MPFDQAGAEDESLPLEENLLPSEIFDLVDEPNSGPEASSPAAPPIEGTTPGATRSGGETGLVPPEFDPRHREEFEGLLYLGALSEEFTWAGHRFKIRTVTVGELLEVGLAQRSYRDSLGDNRAYVTAMAAACIVHVDGKPLPRPLTMEVTDTEFANKFSYVKDSWYPWVIDAVYQQYLLLEQRVTEIIEAMGKASPSAPLTRG